MVVVPAGGQSQRLPNRQAPRQNLPQNQNPSPAQQVAVQSDLRPTETQMNRTITNQPERDRPVTREGASNVQPAPAPANNQQRGPDDDLFDSAIFRQPAEGNGGGNQEYDLDFDFDSSDHAAVDGAIQPNIGNFETNVNNNRQGRA